MNMLYSVVNSITRCAKKAHFLIILNNERVQFVRCKIVKKLAFLNSIQGLYDKNSTSYIVLFTSDVMYKNV